MSRSRTQPHELTIGYPPFRVHDVHDVLPIGENYVANAKRKLQLV